jgi:hypothetical protein
MNEAEASRLASLVCKPLFAAWGAAAQAKLRSLPLHLELTRLGLLARDAEVLATDAHYAVSLVYGRHAYREAAALGVICIAVINEAGATTPPELLRWATVSCSMVFDVSTAHKLLQRVLQDKSIYFSESQVVNLPRVLETIGKQDIPRAQANALLVDLLRGMQDVEEAEQRLPCLVHAEQIAGILWPWRAKRRKE